MLGGRVGWRDGPYAGVDAYSALRKSSIQCSRATTSTLITVIRVGRTGSIGFTYALHTVCSAAYTLLSAIRLFIY